MWQATELVYLGLRQRSIVPTATTAAKTGRTGRPHRDSIPDIAADFTELTGSCGMYFKHD
jgi:hypothetical protein